LALSASRLSWRPSRLAALLLAAVGCASEPASVDLFVDEGSAPPVVVRSEIDKVLATTGDRVTLVQSISAAPGYEVEVEAAPARIGGLEVVDLGEEAPLDSGSRRLERRWYTVRADLVGLYALVPPRVRYRSHAEAPDGEWQETRGVETLVEVESVLPADLEGVELRDIKDIRPYETDTSGRNLALGIALASALAAIGGWLWWRRRRSEPAPVPATPAHEVALAALRRLRETDFEDESAMREFHFAISLVVRAYVEARFAWNATDLTTEEIISSGMVTGISPGDRACLEELLQAADRVKFAAQRPQRSDIESLYENALGFVERTVPPPDEEDGSQAEAA
jgi:hypothetical protein